MHDEDPDDVTDQKKWATEVRVQLDADDASLLDAVTNLEKLPRTEMLRRALRAYARAHGIAPNTSASTAA